MKRHLFICFLLFFGLIRGTQGQDLMSSGDGNWNDPIWVFQSSGLPCSCTPSVTNGEVRISANTNVTITGSVSIDQLVVEGDASLSVNNGGRLIIMDGSGDDLIQEEADFSTTFTNGIVFINSGGILENRGQISSIASDMVFASTAEYQHNINDGEIPLATWQSGSICRITGWGGLTTPTTDFLTSLGQPFHHFIWDCAAQSAANVGFNGALSQVNGDFIVNNTNGRRITFGLNGPGPATGSISGSLIVQNNSKLSINSAGPTPYTLNVGGNVDLNYSTTGTSAPGNAMILTAAGIITLNIAGDLVVNNGELNLATATGTGTINVGGNFLLSGGTVSKSGGGIGTIAFTSGQTHQYTRGSGVFSNHIINFEVGSGATLDLGTYQLGASASVFTSSGNVIVRSTDAGGAIGDNILSGTRTFNSGSTITYTGAGPQSIGSAHPATAGVNTVINNASGVSLIANTTIGGNLTLQSGNLTIGSNTLTLGGNLTPNANTLVISASSSLVINGTGAFGVLPLSGGTSINNFTVNRASSGSVTLGSDLTVEGTLTQLAGRLDLNGFTLTVNNGYSGSGSIGSNASSSLVFNGSGPLPAIAFPTASINTLTLNRASTTLITTGSLTIQNLNLFEGVYNNPASVSIAPGGTITVENGTMTVSPGSTGMYNVVYNNSTTIIADAELSSATDKINNVTISGGADVILENDYTINGNLTLSNGGLDAGTATVTLNGNLVGNSSGSFSTSTFIFNGNTTISGTSIPVFGNVILESGATLTLPAQLSIAGDLQLDAGAVLNHNNGLVVFTGDNNQTVAGGGLVLNNITLNKAEGTSVGLSSALSITGALQIQSANTTFASNGNLRLISTSDGTSGNAMIGPLLNGASVTGSVTVERFMSSEGNIYRYISSPVTTGTVQQLQQSFPVTGAFPQSSSCTGCNTQPSMFYYDALGAQYVVFPTSSNTEILQPGVGYPAYIRQTALSGPVTFSLSGPINQGEIPLPVSHNTNIAESWNLVGNPFPSTIDWDVLAGWTKNNISNTIAVRDNADESQENGGFRYWNGVAGSGIGSGLEGGMIAKGQAFWIRTLGDSPVLTVREQAKSTTSGEFYRSEEPDVLFITVSRGLMNDRAVIHLHEEANEGLDKFDASKMANDKFDLSLRRPGVDQRLAIDATNQISCGSSVILDFTFTKKSNGGYVIDPKGSYTLAFESLGQRFSKYKITLTDHFTGTSETIDENSVYNFSITSDDASLASDRFVLNFDEKTVPDLNLSIEGTELTCADKEISLSVAGTQPELSYYLTMDGNRISEKLDGNGSELNFKVNSGDLSIGNNSINVIAEGACRHQLVSIWHPVKEELVTPVTQAGKQCKEGEVKLSASGAVQGSTYHWYADLTSTEPLFLGADFQTPHLYKSETFYVSAKTQSGCETERVGAVAQIVQFEDAEITVADGDLLVSNHEEGNHWFFNGEQINGAVGQTLKVNQSGTYTLQVSIEGCLTTDQTEYSVTSVEEFANDGVTVSPNPASKELVVRMADFDERVKLAYVINNLGQVEEVTHKFRKRSADTRSINIEHLADGLYYLKLTTSRKDYVIKVIKRTDTDK